jgi:O-antigen/teichoic acid export membrane protein
MSNIRRQSLISSVIIYGGFVLGFINTYLFTMEGGFTPSQYGLVGLFIAIGNIMYSFAALGMHAFIYKFYPYYNDNLPPKKNDILTVALGTAIIGFILVVIAGFVFKDLVVRKFSENSRDLVVYYEWLFPFGFGLTIYSILEAYAWQQKASVLTNTLKEVGFRLLTTVLIILTFAGLINNFDIFVRWYSMTFLIIAVLLLLYLGHKRLMHLPLTISRVTKKFYKKIFALAAFIWTGNLVYTLANVFDSIIIASVLPNGLAAVGVYTLAQNITSLIQAPQRGIISAALAPLSRAWKDKDFGKIQRIYKHSSINQLIFSLGMFLLIWLNFTDGVFTFNLKSGYLDARYVFFFLGLMRVVDMSTGLNAQIIATSTFWRFEFYTGIVLLAIMLPLNYILTKQIGIIGPAISNLVAFSVYNGIRYFFLYRKFKLQPFTVKSVYALMIGAVAYVIAFVIANGETGFLWIVLRSVTFCVVYLAGILYFELTPDLLMVLNAVRERIRRRL